MRGCNLHDRVIHVFDLGLVLDLGSSSLVTVESGKTTNSLAIVNCAQSMCKFLENVRFSRPFFCRVVLIFWVHTPAYFLSDSRCPIRFETLRFSEHRKTVG